MHTPKNSPIDKASDKAVSDHTASSETTEFHLPPVEWEAFCQRLDAPPRTIPALEQLFGEADPFQD